MKRNLGLNPEFKKAFTNITGKKAKGFMAIVSYEGEVDNVGLFVDGMDFNLYSALCSALTHDRQLYEFVKSAVEASGELGNADSVLNKALEELIAKFGNSVKNKPKKKKGKKDLI